MPDETPSTNQAIPRTVKTLGAVSLFNDVASEMIYPIVPIFLTTVLGAPIEIIGVIEGVAEATASILKVLSGWWSDKVGRRKPLVIAGYSLSTLSKPLLAAAYVWPVVLIGRFLDRFGKGVRTAARDAWIADVTPESIRGKSFGFHRMLDTIGAIAGPLVAAAFLTYWHDRFRLLFVAAFIPGVIAVIILAAVAREASQVTPLVSKMKFEKHGWKKIPAQLWLLIGISLVFGVANSSDAFLILRGKLLGWSTVAAVLAYAVYNTTYAFGSYPAGYFSDKIPRKYLIAAGFVVFAAVYYFFGAAHTTAILWLLFPIYGLSVALTDGASRALIADFAPRDIYGLSYGFYSAGSSIANLAASIWFGAVWQIFGAGRAFSISAILAVAAAVGLVLLVKKPAPAEVL